jgi:hypothetical protein
MWAAGLWCVLTVVSSVSELFSPFQPFSARQVLLKGNAAIRDVAADFRVLLRCPFGTVFVVEPDAQRLARVVCA